MNKTGASKPRSFSVAGALINALVALTTKPLWLLFGCAVGFADLIVLEVLENYWDNEQYLAVGLGWMLNLAVFTWPSAVLPYNLYHLLSGRELTIKEGFSETVSRLKALYTLNLVLSAFMVPALVLSKQIDAAYNPPGWAALLTAVVGVPMVVTGIIYTWILLTDFIVRGWQGPSSLRLPFDLTMHHFWRWIGLLALIAVISAPVVVIEESAPKLVEAFTSGEGIPPNIFSITLFVYTYSLITTLIVHLSITSAYHQLTSVNPRTSTPSSDDSLAASTQSLS